ncbi:YebC/PmpR family DNA-binding transcriptional regulator [Candidatus Wolfebacteria bacterium]|nr:YebC/PmpR family DNA-binding transcriptional regulator [Candidatus Wolfebacteria bacterium]
MSGHSHFAGIKHKKEITDQKRSRVFSKLLNVISITARIETNPQFNPQLKAAIDKAKENQVPQDKIEKAIKKALENKDLEEMIIEAYGPEGAAILIEIITDNKNRTIAEVKKIINDNEAKFAETGSVRWAFERVKTDTGLKWKEKFKQEISIKGKEGLQKLIEKLLEQNEVQEIYTNA